MADAHELSFFLDQALLKSPLDILQAQLSEPEAKCIAYQLITVNYGVSFKQSPLCGCDGLVRQI